MFREKDVENFKCKNGMDIFSDFLKINKKYLIYI